MRFFTMANDARLTDFLRFLQFFFAFNPEKNLHVIPFDDGFEKISKIINEDERLIFVPADPGIDSIGQAVYADEYYRPDVPAWRYFRKFNVFCGHDEPFFFLDVNSVVLSSWEDEWYFSEIDRNSVYFRGPSAIRRTLPKEHFSLTLTELGLKSSSGYNMGGFISHGGVFDTALALTLARPELRKVFGSAPEQAFMALYLGVFGIDNGLMTSIAPSIRFRYDGGPLVYQDGKTIVGDAPEHIILATKYTGVDYTPHPREMDEILSQRLSMIGKPRS